MNRLIKMWVLLLGISFFPRLSMAQTPKKYLNIGKEFFVKQNYADAIIQFSKAIEIDPNYVKAYIERAVVYKKIDSLENAALDYRRASVFLKKNSDVLLMSGVLFNRVGKYKEALEMFNQISKKRKNAECFSQEAYSYLQLKNDFKAIGAADSAIAIKPDAVSYYYRGVASYRLKDFSQAENSFTKSILLNSQYVNSFLFRAELYLEKKQLDKAMADVNSVLSIDNKNIEGYVLRSKIYVKKIEYPDAINDISRVMIIDPDNMEMYRVRGEYYQQFGQHTNAITDFNKAIVSDNNNPIFYFLRAKSYEEILDYKKAVKDYEKIGELSKYDGDAMKLKDEATARMFELNREADAPVIKILTPDLSSDGSLNVAKGEVEMLFKGRVDEQSPITELMINGKSITTDKYEDYYVFVASVSIDSVTKLDISAVDVYNNRGTKSYKITRTEINSPEIKLMAPYASDNGEIYLFNDNNNVYVEGQIVDESYISSIMIDGVLASYKPNTLNPSFNANINILNKNKFSIDVVDEFGNKTSHDFVLNRDGIMSSDNPMGKTWAIFICNSDYKTFASLEGPKKDINAMKGALVNYQVSNVITKEDMTKTQLERFFSIELRDLVRSNQVKSLMVWYAGHGKSVNDVGYWIPVDAKRDDEFTYYNVNQLKVAFQAYANFVVHTLIVTDACESGPTFYQAMRGTPKERDCNDWKSTRFKSSQVFSSAGYEEASDNSQFSRTFANALTNNPNSCIPIESIVSQVTVAVEKNNQQKPQFGKISGLEDEDGTFFFISK